jgi:anti-sigma B factor antagonist
VSPVPLFRVTVEPLEETRLIRARGELDRSTADRLSSALDAARADGVTALLDLSAVSFIDSAGLRVLLHSAGAVNAHDWAWFIVRASRAVWRLVELSGTRSQLPVVAPPSSMRIAPLKTPLSASLANARAAVQ